MLSDSDGQKLILLARKSIESYFSKSKIDLSSYEKYDKKQGVFVTLHKHGKLRGCIGFPYPVLELYKAVFEGARAAAFEDPRFSPLTESELEEVDIEVSVLTVPEEIKVDDRSVLAGQVKIGSDGLIIKGPGGSGLLLPQVFTEYKCDGERALEMVCEKAGLPRDAWRSGEFTLYKFQAQVFEEKR